LIGTRNGNELYRLAKKASSTVRCSCVPAV
jgi:hypothetical protein